MHFSIIDDNIHYLFLLNNLQTSESATGVAVSGIETCVVVTQLIHIYKTHNNNMHSSGRVKADCNSSVS